MFRILWMVQRGSEMRAACARPPLFGWNVLAALRPSLFYGAEQAAYATFHLPVFVLYKSSIASAARCIGAFTNEFRFGIMCFCVEFQLSHLQRNTFRLQRMIFIIDEQSRGSVIRSSTQKFDSICL